MVVRRGTWWCGGVAHGGAARLAGTHALVVRDVRRGPAARIEPAADAVGVHARANRLIGPPTVSTRHKPASASAFASAAVATAAAAAAAATRCRRGPRRPTAPLRAAAL
eukprot:5985096-Prymnesium_polylepis.1